MYIKRRFKYVKKILGKSAMHLAILMTNTDHSAFAQQHPKDGAKFTALLHLVRPDWQTTVFTVTDMDFPHNISDFDGVIITGSPASVHDPAPWVARLLGLIRQISDQKIPMFGACFGHQAIALALGGQVTRNPGGWVFGQTQTTLTHRMPWMRALPGQLRLYAAHVEQVTKLPAGAQILTTNPACPIGGFALGRHIYTTQYHPEMTAEFIAALVQHLSTDLPPDVIARARDSLTQPADTLAFAGSLAQFFEHTT